MEEKEDQRSPHSRPGLPSRQGLYDPAFERDACGVGFLCNVRGERSNLLVRQGLEVLRRLSHRGAVGADPLTGDGAGILLQMPHEFFAAACDEAGIPLCTAGQYGTGLVFLPRDPAERRWCKDVFTRIVTADAHVLLGWRPVPVDNTVIGETARATEPVIEQVFIARNPVIHDLMDFERRLYLIRKEVENKVRASHLRQRSFFYVTNLSSRTFLYKGLLMPDQVDRFFLDLRDERLESALCLVHSRYSTNTFPTWDLAQPFRFLAHNGEINTLRGNINWMRAREGSLASTLFGQAVRHVKPVILPGGSDSASLDNAFELLMMAGRSLPHAMMMLVPGAWESDRRMPPEVRDFYRYHASFMEPWDGPAALAFTDGTRVGAVLDRNGLRPARYLVTRDDLVVMASEVGVLDISPDRISRSGRLEPGKIFYIDTEEGRIVEDQEVKESMAAARPYGRWLKENLVSLGELPPGPATRKAPRELLPLLASFGYSREDLRLILRPMAEKGEEPVGSMGNDAPHAILSTRPQLLFSYFKQLFAQVTNPPVDPIREELVMSLESYVGTQRNILEELPEHCRKLHAASPVLDDDELERIRHIRTAGFSARTVSLLFRAEEGPGLATALERVCRGAESAIEEGCSFVVLSDRGVDREHASVPALLAVGAVHHHLVRKAMRTRIGIVLESGEPREVHHFALLFGYGADLVNPYLAQEALAHLAAGGDLDLPLPKAAANYRKAVKKGILKILSKMGISTLQSYRGAQIFEALGLGEEVVERCFTGTPSRIGGAGFAQLEEEVLARHRAAWPPREERALPVLPTGGVYAWKKDGEHHLWNPESIAALQDAVRNEDWSRWGEFARLINDQAGHPTTLRSLLRFRPGTTPVPLEEVEPAGEIFRRFATGAMSFGSISRGAHETLALAMNRIGGRSNTGEGGEDPARFLPLPDGDSLRSAIKQVASGRFGVTTNYLTNADELQIKMAQGAKPGEGGQLPGHKVSAIIARTRYTTPGVTLISPPPHHDIYSIEDLAQLIFDLKNVNPRARISVKLVSEIGVGTVAAGVAKGHADMILISGGDGGTGASPWSSIKHAGLPWELGLSETHQTLVLNDLRSRVRLQTDGQLRTGRDVAIAAILGAEEFGFCTAALVVMGCVMLRHCNLNNCSVGVATQDEILQGRFRGRPEHVVTYFSFVARELREIMASLGVQRVEELIGRTDLLEPAADLFPPKAAGLDFGRILHRPEVPPTVEVRQTREQDHGLEAVLDRTLIREAADALQHGRPVRLEFPIRNHHRTVGAMLSGEICRRHGEEYLPDGTIHCRFSGEAGQSFGAWLARGVTLELEGLANDYVGKGMSGGRVVIYPGRDAGYLPEENILIGNTTFYGATAGEAFIRGRAGERFCIRNSGVRAVVEGVGDHGCEYMTGGVAVVLGPTGRNFAAGMSGGVAYVWDPDGDFASRCNREMVDLETPDAEDLAALRHLLHDHRRWTGSPVAARLLEDFHREAARFVKVMPQEYKRVLAASRPAAGGEGSDG
jgi:glutamate synthase domain-containing protein 2/glutamate synthase domain-containing protein 1/glutamate synthase domain-containing protein 3